MTGQINKGRECAACGRDMFRRKAYAKAGKKVICMVCGGHGYAAFNAKSELVLHPGANPYTHPGWKDNLYAETRRREQELAK